VTENSERVSPLAVVAAGAAAALKGAWLLALTTALSAVLMWSWVFSPFQFGHWWSAVLAAVILLLLLSPAAVLFLVALTLRQLAYLPHALLERSKEARNQVGAAASSVRPGTDATAGRRARRLGRALLDLWTLVTESRGMLLQYAGLVRLANPVSLVVVSIALVTGCMQIGAAVIALGVLLIF